MWSSCCLQCYDPIKFFVSDSGFFCQHLGNYGKLPCEFVIRATLRHLMILNESSSILTGCSCPLPLGTPRSTNHGMEPSLLARAPWPLPWPWCPRWQFCLLCSDGHLPPPHLSCQDSVIPTDRRELISRMASPPIEPSPSQGHPPPNFPRMSVPPSSVPSIA